MHKLIDLMGKIQNPGRFSVSGKLEATQPGIKVQGVGVISLPFIEFQANQLIEQCEQAPFGRGEETVVDTQIRNVWQLSPEQIDITNPDWNTSLQKGVQSIAKQLGLQGRTVKADLYKLLVYKKGSFFVPHRDTEKIPNMFATMVVHLPSQHKGGELIISHGGKSESYSFADGNGFNPEFVAFYADCFHEVKPVTAGYRLCLIYNLAVTEGDQPVTLSAQSDTANEVGDYLRQWRVNIEDSLSNPVEDSDDNPSSLACLLEHSYSEENLSISNLKNGDFARASVLMREAEKNNCRAFLCLVSYYRLSYGDCYNSGYRYEEPNEDDFEEYDVEEEKTYAHHFVSSIGEKIPVNELPLEEHQILAKISLMGGEKDIEISEATGNEGATKELWYHRGAVIIWPMRNDIDIAMKADTDYGIYYLAQYLRTHNAAKHDDAILKLAHHLVDNHRRYAPSNILDSLIKMGDIDLLGKFIDKQLSLGLNQFEPPKLIAVMDQFGWDTFADKMGEVISDCLNSYRKQEVMPFLGGLLLSKKLTVEGQQTVAHWFQDVWRSKSPWRNGMNQDALVLLLQSVALIENQSLADEVLGYLSKRMKDLFLVETYGPAFVKTWDIVKDANESATTIMKKFAKDILERLQKDHSNAPSAPENWYRSGQLKCSCEFCKQVNAFLPNAEQEAINFQKTLKRNLTHIEERITNAGIDLAIKIERQAPKFMGRCYKTQTSFDDELDLYNQAQEIKANILKMGD